MLNWDREKRDVTMFLYNSSVTDISSTPHGLVFVVPKFRMDRETHEHDAPGSAGPHCTRPGLVSGHAQDVAAKIQWNSEGMVYLALFMRLVEGLRRRICNDWNNFWFTASVPPSLVGAAHIGF